MSHRVGLARSFAQTKPGKLVITAIALLLVIGVGVSMVGPNTLPCAESGDETIVLSLDKEQKFALPSGKGCWTPWLLRPTKAKGFQYTADTTVQVGIAYTDGTTRELVYDPKFGNVDLNPITAVRFKSGRGKEVILRLLISK